MLRHLQQIEANERIDGVPNFLISANIMCTLCCSNLRLRKDRPASNVIYDKDLGTVHGSHFHKYCVNQACGCTQYYGYYTTGGSSSEVVYNDDWATLQYFVSNGFFFVTFAANQCRNIDQTDEFQGIH